MQLHILNDQQVRLVADTSDGLDIQGAPFGPLQMLATSLALCTAAVIHDYAVTAQIKLDQFAVDVQWEYADHPYRVGRIEMTLLVAPDVPPSRHRALLRAAEQCTVHNTLSHSPSINMGLEVHGAEQA
jgi:putative redox protein